MADPYPPDPKWSQSLIPRCAHDVYFPDKERGAKLNRCCGLCSCVSPESNRRHFSTRQVNEFLKEELEKDFKVVATSDSSEPDDSEISESELENSEEN